jgi:hypothetical protein
MLTNVAEGLDPVGTSTCGCLSVSGCCQQWGQHISEGDKVSQLGCPRPISFCLYTKVRLCKYK